MIPMKCNRIKDYLLDLIFPNRCFLCNIIISWDKLCCDSCLEKIPYIDEKICPKCGKSNCICDLGICYDRCFSVAWYDKMMRNAVVRFKVESPHNFAKFFADKISEMIKEEHISIDIVTCTPMSKKSLKERGYNQASYLGKYVAKELNLPFDDNILIKKDSEVHQHDLSFEERLENSFKSFSFNASKDVKGKRILLIDDIITTGSTLNACSRLLKNHNASFVACATACNRRFENPENVDN